MFLQIYGYNISTPGFADEAIAKLKDLGCGKAGEYYEQIISEWKEGHEKALQEAEAWYRKQDSYKKEGEERRKTQEEVELLLKRKKLLVRKKLQILTDN